MTDFIDVAVVADPTTLAANAITAYTGILQANGFPGYVPNNGDGEIIEFTVCAQMFADIAGIVSQVPAAIFRQFGTQLLGIMYAQGSYAGISTTWTLADSLGHTIPAGTYVTVASLGFYVQATVVVPAGQSSATVSLVAVSLGTLYNGVSGPIAPVDQLNYVLSITAVNPSSGGAAAQDDLLYQSGLSAELELQAPRPITSSDFAAFVLSPSATNATGVTVGRATAIDGYDPGVYSLTGTTNGTITVSAISSFSGVTVGSVLSGVNIPANTTVATINPGGSSLTMSVAASGSATGQAITSTGSYGNQREESVFVTDINGLAFAGASTTSTAGANCLALQAWLQSRREANFLVNVLAPSTTPVYVTAAVHVLPTYDGPTVAAAVQAALVNYLNPATWGNPGIVGSSLANVWLNSVQGFSTVRYNSLVGIIEGVAGVQYVPSGSAGLTVGFAASPTGVADLILPGPAPLASSTTTSIVVSTI